MSIRRIESLFAKFSAIYGAKFADQWAGIDQGKVKSTWAQGLAELRSGEIVEGIERLIRGGSPFPPTLPEFFRHCRPRIEIPPVGDHAGLDEFARRFAVMTAGCDSYYALRQRICERMACHSAPALEAQERAERD